MRWSSRLAASSLFFLSLFSYGQEESTESQQDPIIDKANQILRETGLKSAHVIKSPEGRLVLAGTFDTYDEFLFALMLMNLHFGFDKVKPVYDYRLAVIKKSTVELCFPYAVRGELCPYGRFTIEKKPAQTAGDKAQKKYALVIGVSRFRKVNPVAGANNDARTVAKYLRDRGYDVTMLIDEQATVENVRKAISEIYSKVRDGDELVVFAASHGAPVDEGGEVGIVLYDSTAEEQNNRFCRVDAVRGRVAYIDEARKMCTLVKNAFSIREHIINTFADKKVNTVVLLDACYSGDALRSYVGSALPPYEVATTPEYENALRHAPNLGILTSAASGDRMSWGGPIAGEYRSRLLSFAGGSPRYVSVAGDGGATQAGTARAIVVEGKGGKQKRPQPAQKPTQEQKDSIPANGVFTAFILEGLAKSDHSLMRAYESTKQDINHVSRLMCINEFKQKCPPDGQNPVIYRVRMQDYIFGR